MLHLFKDQPRAFSMIFMLELWERFGFYTVQGILTLYFIRYLGFNETDAYYTFGAFSALVYGLIVIGGYLGDRILGTKRSILLGLIVLCLGYCALALTNKDHVFLALGLICVGNGIFKANPSNLLSKCYKENDPRIDGAFTLYYMAINLGSMVALIAGPAISSKYGYSYAYSLSAIGLLVGIANYWLRYQYIAPFNTEADLRTVSLLSWFIIGVGIISLTGLAAFLLQHVVIAKNLLLCIGACVLAYYCYLMRMENRATSLRMLIALLLMFEAITFFTLYQQMPTSITLFALNNVTPNFLGIAIDPQSFQALNPIWIVLLSPILATTYSQLNKKGWSFPMPYKFALGITMCGLSFLILYPARYFYTGAGMLSSWWLIVSYMFQSLSELLVSALGLAMVAELVPSRHAGFVMGMWFLTSAVAGFLGATVASYTALPELVKPGVDSLIIYTDVFGSIGVVALFISLLMWLLAPVLSRYIKLST